MSKVQELKEAVDQLEIDLAELAAAKEELSSWQLHDLSRREGSGRQEAMHEKRGEELADQVWHANRKVESQKNRISSLLTAA